MLRNLLRRWLGLNKQSLDIKLNDMSYDLHKISRDVAENTIALNNIIGRLLDESDPLRKTMSDKLGNDIRARLIAEDKARRVTTGEPFPDYSKL